MCEVMDVIVNDEQKENMWSNSRIDKILISYKCLYIVKVSQVCNLNPFLLFLTLIRHFNWICSRVTEVEPF